MVLVDDKMYLFLSVIVSYSKNDFLKIVLRLMRNTILHAYSTYLPSHFNSI